MIGRKMGAIMIGVAISLSLFFPASLSALEQEEGAEMMVAPSGEEFPVAQKAEVKKINSYELFWPVVAGKRTGDSLYFLKRAKENARRIFIFNPLRKADYDCFLATKRLVEAESLLESDREVDGKKTLVAVTTNLNNAKKGIVKARNKGVSFGDTGENIIRQVANLETFSLWYKSQEGVEVEPFEEIIRMVGEIRDMI